MPRTRELRRLVDAYTFPGFRPRASVQGLFCDPHARLVTLVRRGNETIGGACRTVHRGWYDRTRRRARDLPCGPYRIYLDPEVRRVECRRCGKVKRKRLELLLENALHTERVARYVGRRCRTGTIDDIAKEMNLDWRTVKRMEMRYLRMQLVRAAKPSPQALKIDEVSIRKGHVYRIVVRDLHRQRPIWFGGKDRSEQSMDELYRLLAEKKARKVRLALMDMWKPCRNSTTRHAPQAAILFDKFHILRHLGDALDKVRKQEYARLSGKGRAFIEGQKYALLAHPHNLEGSARKNLKRLLAATKQLNTAYLLKESFRQIWYYRSEAWARKLFENLRAQLKWQRHKSYEKFAEMIDRHWDGIAAYCNPRNKVSLGFVEGLNNRIRLI